MFYKNLELLAAVSMGLGESRMHIMKEGGTRHSNTRYRGNIFTVLILQVILTFPALAGKRETGAGEETFQHGHQSNYFVTKQHGAKFS